MSFTFTNQVEENVGMILRFPYHIDNTHLITPCPIPYPSAQMARSFERVLQKAYNEPFAIYLTDDDRTFYSPQELLLFDKVIAFEQDRINNGMCKIDIEINAETMDMLLDYKTKHHMTFEGAINYLLKSTIENNSQVSEEREGIKANG